jgi:2-dehydro-3-deoxygluconokinase
MAARTVCLGEILLRLSAPGRELLLQSPRLAVHVGGAEANVAVSLARFGHSAAMASVVPDNPLGAAAVGELRRHGVDTTQVKVGSGRMGIYFLVTGAIHRSSEVLYDRAGSAFALHADSIDTETMLAGADALHVSGVTPALGAGPAAAARRAMEMASARKLAVSFDCNYRAKLWETSGADAAGALRGLAGLAGTLFGNARDLALMLGRAFGDASSSDGFRAAGAAAFEAFPRLERIATMVRQQNSVDHHDMTAWMLTRARLVAARSYAVGPIVDRIGAGDAFAAGVLHGLRRGYDEEQMLNFGLAAACLKHSVPGDFNLVGESDVRALMDDAGFGVRR